MRSGRRRNARNISRHHGLSFCWDILYYGETSVKFRSSQIRNPDCAGAVVGVSIDLGNPPTQCADSIPRTTTEESSSSRIPHPEVQGESHHANSTDQIFGMLRQIRVLQFQLTQLAQARASSRTSLHRFLEDVSEYAESVYPASDGASIRAAVAQEDDLESHSDDFHSAKESFSDSARPSSLIDHQSTEDLELMPTYATDTLEFSNLATTLSRSNIQSIPVRSSSTFSGISTWSSIRLRISNRFYNFRAASDTTRNMLSAIAVSIYFIH